MMRVRRGSRRDKLTGWKKSENRGEGRGGGGGSQGENLHDMAIKT